MKMIDMVREKVCVRAQMVEPIATVALTGVAEDRSSKIIVGVGVASMVIGTVAGSKVLAMIGISTFMYGFARGFKRAMQDAAG